MPKVKPLPEIVTALFEAEPRIWSLDQLLAALPAKYRKRGKVGRDRVGQAAAQVARTLGWQRRSRGGPLSYVIYAPAAITIIEPLKQNRPPGKVRRYWAEKIRAVLDANPAWDWTLEELADISDLPQPLTQQELSRFKAVARQAVESSGGRVETGSDGIVRYVGAVAVADKTKRTRRALNNGRRGGFYL